MTIKELSQLYHLNREIEMDKRRLDELELLASSPKAQNLDGMPHGVVAPLIALKALLRVRDVISGAHLMKSVPVSRVKIKQCVVCVQQQIGVFHVVAPVIIW